MAQATDRTETTTPSGNRWLLVAAALLLQFSIGAVYAWSVFSKALKEAPAFKLTPVEASLPFTVTIGMIFIGSYLGGRIQDRRGPRPVAMAGGVIYSLGVMLASFAQNGDQLWLIILGYGVISGFGLGFAYIVPIAMLLKWFPDKRGLITGLAVGGFGFGAVLTSPVAQWLIHNNPDRPTSAFLPLGIAYLVMSLIGASFFRNPPAGYTVPGYEPSASGTGSNGGTDYTQGEALRTPQWYLLTAILTLNVTAGIALISQAAASAADIAGYTAAGAAAVVGVLAVFNGGGRIVWAAASDFIGRMPAFALMLGLQGVCLLILPHASNAVALLRPRRDRLPLLRRRLRHHAGDRGRLLRREVRGRDLRPDARRLEHGGVIGPIIISALIGGDKNYTVGYTTIGIIALASMVLTFITKVPAARREATEVHR